MVSINLDIFYSNVFNIASFNDFYNDYDIMKFWDICEKNYTRYVDFFKSGKTCIALLHILKFRDNWSIHKKVKNYERKNDIETEIPKNISFLYPNHTETRQCAYRDLKILKVMK